MNETDLRAKWLGLKRQVDEKPCSGVLGLDLIRGEFLKTEDVLNYSHLQVFGDDRFLRNIMQRTLEWDTNQAMLIIILTLEREPELLEEVFKVYLDGVPENSKTFIRYPHLLWKNLKPTSTLFKAGECSYVYAELSSGNAAMDGQLLTYLNKQIAKLFDSENFSGLQQKRPFIYLFYPEKFSATHPIENYANWLKDSATFRIFSQHTHFFTRDESSLLYGPRRDRDHEKMRRYFYEMFEKKRKWKRENEFFGDGENDAALKVEKNLAKSIPLDQTAFGRFKTWDERFTDYHWFYPVRQSLGKMPYQPSPPPPAIRKQFRRFVKKTAVSSDYDPSVSDIIEDLRPKPQWFRHTCETLKVSSS